MMPHGGGDRVSSNVAPTVRDMPVTRTLSMRCFSLAAWVPSERSDQDALVDLVGEGSFRCLLLLERMSVPHIRGA